MRITAEVRPGLSQHNPSPLTPSLALDLSLHYLLTIQELFRNKRTLGHLVAEKLVSLCSKEMENSPGAKWPCDFKSPWHRIYLQVFL